MSWLSSSYLEDSNTDCGSQGMFAHYLASTLQMHSVSSAISEQFSGTTPMEVSDADLSRGYCILILQWAVLLILCFHCELETLSETWVVFISVQSSCNTSLSLTRVALMKSIPEGSGFCALHVCST